MGIPLVVGGVNFPSRIRGLFGLSFPMKLMGIYAIKHTASGRVYIGSSSNLSVRFRDHRRLLRLGKHPNVYLQRSWDRHGSDAFSFYVVEEVDQIDRLLEREQFYIDTLDSACHTKGFNLSPTAGSSRGCVRSAETRALLSKIQKGRRHTPEARAKISQAQLGKKHSPERCRNISASQRRPEVRARLSAAGKAWALTPEGIANHQLLAKLARGRKKTAEEREAIRVRTTGFKASESAKAAMREASRRFWDSPAGKTRAAEHSAMLKEKHRNNQAVA